MQSVGLLNAVAGSFPLLAARRQKGRNFEGSGAVGGGCLGMGWGGEEGKTRNWVRIAVVVTTGTRSLTNIRSVYKATSGGKHWPNLDFEELSFKVLHTTSQMPRKGLLGALGPLLHPNRLLSALSGSWLRRPINHAGQ